VCSSDLTGRPGHRTAFLHLAQGDLNWWLPVAVEMRPPLEIITSAVQDNAGVRFRVRNNAAEVLDGEAVIRIAGEEIRRRVSAGPGKESEEILVPASGLPPGTHPVCVDFGKGRKASSRVVNWHLAPVSAGWEPVPMDSLFNDQVTRIFRNEYVSPRSPFCSLALPKQGIGGWCDFKTTAEIDDSGLRASSARQDGLFRSPLGVPFRTPGNTDAKNVLFASHWDNYPR